MMPDTCRSMKLFGVFSRFAVTCLCCLAAQVSADQPPLILQPWLRSLIELQARDIAGHVPKEHAEGFLRGPSDFFRRVAAGDARRITSPYYAQFLEVVKVYAGESSTAVDGDLPLEHWVKVRPMYASLAADPGPPEAFPGHYLIFKATMRRMEKMFKVEKELGKLGVSGQSLTAWSWAALSVQPPSLIDS